MSRTFRDLHQGEEIAIVTLVDVMSALKNAGQARVDDCWVIDSYAV